MSVEKLITFILVAVVIAIILLATVKPIRDVVNHFFGLNFFEGSNEIIKGGAISRFTDLKNILDGCMIKENTNCFCTNENIFFPTKYRLEINNDNQFKVYINLLSETKQKLNSINLDVAGCGLVKKISTTQIDDPLYLVYGKNPVIEYKRKKFDFFIDYVFYKKDNQLCIVEKDLVEGLGKNIC